MWGEGSIIAGRIRHLPDVSAFSSAEGLANLDSDLDEAGVLLEMALLRVLMVPAGSNSAISADYHDEVVGLELRTRSR